MTPIAIIKIVGFKLWFRLFLNDIKSAIQKKLFCKVFNVHKIYAGAESVTNSKGKTIKCDYLTCPRCNKYYFRNKYQKEQFRRIQESQRTMWTKILSDIVVPYSRKKHKIVEFEK